MSLMNVDYFIRTQLLQDYLQIIYNINNQHFSASNNSLSPITMRIIFRSFSVMVISGNDRFCHSLFSIVISGALRILKLSK